MRSLGAQDGCGSGLPFAHRVATAGGLALAAAVRVVDRVHGDAMDAGRRPFQRIRPALPC